jgi:Mce-associated membrane protein
MEGASVAMKVRIVAALLVVISIASGYAGYTWYQARQRSAAEAAALAAARQFAVDFVSINAATVDQDLSRVALGATGEFGDEYQRGMPTVRAAVLENKVQAGGNVLRAALVNADADSAVALVAVDATVKNVKSPNGRVAHYRLQLDLVLEEGSDRWRVSKLLFVG